MNYFLTQKDLARIFGVSAATISRGIKKGGKLGDIRYVIISGARLYNINDVAKFAGLSVDEVYETIRS